MGLACVETATCNLTRYRINESLENKLGSRKRGTKIFFKKVRVATPWYLVFFETFFKAAICDRLSDMT